MMVVVHLLPTCWLPRTPQGYQRRVCVAPQFVHLATLNVLISQHNGHAIPKGLSSADTADVGTYCLLSYCCHGSCEVTDHEGALPPASQEPAGTHLEVAYLKAVASQERARPVLRLLVPNRPDAGASALVLASLLGNRADSQPLPGHQPVRGLKTLRALDRGRPAVANGDVSRLSA